MILGIETATEVCSAALLHGEDVWERTLAGGRRHDAHLLGMIDEVLNEAHQPRSSISGIAVSSGPGSYTGLRIGVSVAKALSEALSAPLISVPSLLACGLASFEPSSSGRDGVAAGGSDARVVAFPSRRGEVFAAAVRAGSNGAEQVGDTLAGTPEAILQGLREDGIEPALAIGPAAASFEELLPFRPTACSGRAVARLGLQLLNRGAFVDAELFEPYYLKEFVAGIPTRSQFARLPF